MDVSNRIRSILLKKPIASIILATGSSQLKFLKNLRSEAVSWEKIVIFHLDEYIGLEDNHSASFRNYLIKNIINYIKPKKFFPINPDLKKFDLTKSNYSMNLKKYPVDIACIGIGENGHIAFNDPDEADFNDKESIKIVELDQECRNQQFNEGWFDNIDLVPKKAITLTIPEIMKSKHISCFVPENRKAKAVYNTLKGNVEEVCPASILQLHKSVNLFLDNESSSLI